ncbi:MAG: O-antigen ligase family protein [Anaerolineales bacterium]|nr:O-antigen ligase family protein [Anaerolineales bacterium]
MIVHDWQHTLIHDRSKWRPFGFVILAVLCGLLLVRLPVSSLLLLMAATAVVILTLIRPLIGLSVTLIIAPLGALENQILGGTSLDSGQLLLLFTLAVWIARGMLRQRVIIPKTTLNLPFLLVLLITLFTLPGSAAPNIGLREWLKWLEMALIMLMVVDLGREHPQKRDQTIIWCVSMLLLAGISQAVIGIWQFGLRGDGPEHFIVLGRFYRAYGTYEQPNPFGGFMNLSLLLGLGVLLGLLTAWWHNRHLRHDSWGKWLLLVGGVLLAVVLTGLGLIFSWSRGAWLGFAAGTAVIIFFWPRQQRWGGLLLTLFIVLFGIGLWLNIVPTAVTGRLASFTTDLRFGDVRGVDINDANYSVIERLAHWQAALGMATDNVWSGVGFGNYEPAYAEYALINWPAPLGHAHNYYLNLLAEVGIIGLTIYGFFWLAVFWRTWQQLKWLPWPMRGVALGLMGVWTGFAVHQLVDKLYVNNIYIHLGVMFGLLQLLADVGQHATRAVLRGEG